MSEIKGSFVERTGVTKSEIAAFMGVTVASLSMAFGIMKADSEQQKTIRDDLEVEAKQLVNGYDRLLTDPGPVPIYRSENTARVELTSGAECVVKFKTDGGDLGTLFLDKHATIVDFGTCPSRDQ